MRRILVIVICVLFATPAFAASKPYKEEDCGKFAAQPDLNECSGNNYDAADKALNALYRRVMSLEKNANAKTRLRMSERAWIASRDKACADAAGPQHEGGSIWPMEMNNCLQEKTDARIHTLALMVRGSS